MSLYGNLIILKEQFSRLGNLFSRIFNGANRFVKLLKTLVLETLSGSPFHQRLHKNF